MLSRSRVPLHLRPRARTSENDALPSRGRLFFHAWRPLDVFAAVNIALFVAMCAFTYYARFVAYRGAANIWEFFVYACAIIVAIVIAWGRLRRYELSARLLLLVQIGILAHFAGAFIQVDGRRLYDSYVLGIRYDKYVHFTNAFVVARLVSRVIVAHRVRFDGLMRFIAGLSVLGLGAIVEIIEYLVMQTVPGNGVGGYDNNMQDLMANLVGTAVSIGTIPWVWTDRRLRRVDAGPVTPARERWLSIAELVAFPAAALAALWWLPLWVSEPAFIVTVALVMGLLAVYTCWFSPVALHRDSLAERGLGSWRSGFVRTDNFRVVSRQFAWVALAGTTLILGLAAVWNPRWFADANWRSWGVRLVGYSVSASLQSLMFVGFFIVRLRNVVGAETLGRRLVLASIVGLAFGILHAPDVRAVMLTAAFGFASAWIVAREPNVAAAALCQTLLGVLLHRVLDVGLRVGYFHSHPGLYVFRRLFGPVAWWVGDRY